MGENTPTVKTAVIAMAIHNRCEFTLKCLESIDSQVIPESWATRIVIIDDGSTDHSSEKISTTYPNILIIPGDGSLFWGGGMELAMREARQKFDPDAIIWLNNDVLLAENALGQLINHIETHTQSVVGLTITDEATGTAPNYGGRYINRWTLSVSHIPPNLDRATSVDCLNGNLLAIPKPVYQKIGDIHGHIFKHGGGDFDYTLRAGKAGFDVTLLSGVGGRSLHDHKSDPEKPYQGVINELQMLFSTKSMHPRGWWSLCIRHSRLGPALFLWSYLKRIVYIIVLRRRFTSS